MPMEDPIDLDFDAEHGVPPRMRSYPIINFPPGYDVSPSSVLPQPFIFTETFYIDRNVEIHNLRELAYAILAQAWRRLTDCRFSDNRIMPEKFYRINFTFSTQVALLWWRHVFIIRMMNELSKVEETAQASFPFDKPFYRLDIIC